MRKEPFHDEKLKDKEATQTLYCLFATTENNYL